MQFKLRSIIIILLLLSLNSYAQTAGKDVYDGLRTKWYNFLTGNDASVPYDVSSAKQTWASLNKSADAKTLWNDLDYYYSKDITTSYRRINVLAHAYCVTTSPLYHNTGLKTDILNAMAWMYANQYSERVQHPEASKGSNIKNWWDYQIGTPLELNDAIVFMYNDLPEGDRVKYLNVSKHFTPNFKESYSDKPQTGFTGANRVWISNVIAIRGIILKDSTQISYASRSLSPVFPYVTAGDGFYADGSFIQHTKFAYTGGYGISLLTNLAQELYLLKGSPWAVTDPNLRNVFGWVYNSYAPIIFKGGLMSMTMGREISRRDVEEQSKSRLAVQGVSILADMAPPEHAAKLKSLVKAWALDGTPKRYPGRTIMFINKILEDNSIRPDTTSNYAYRQFANMDKAVQRTPVYAFAISMHSLNRTYNYETRTGYENIKGWHTGDGQTYLYTADTAQFNSDFWPTVNSYRLPGTTVAENTEVPGYKRNGNDWAGGAALLDKYGVSGLDFAPVGQEVMAKKSWFMLDGKIVCLGAAITTKGNKNIHTYIEQRKLNKNNNNEFVINGVLQAPSKGKSEIRNVIWAHLSGSVPGSEIGYYFPGGITLNTDRELQKGSWKDINVNQNPAQKSNYYLTFWKDHGVNATNKNSDANQYVYILLPGYSKAKTAAYAAKPDVIILENTDKVQAIEDGKSNIIAANFWQQKEVSITANSTPGYLTCDNKASVIMMHSNSNGKLYIAVSDPTMDNTDGINIKIKEKGVSIISDDPSIKISISSDMVDLHINTNGLKGKSCVVELKLASFK